MCGICVQGFNMAFIQVCWYWKYLTEANEIWQIKCLRLGWFLPTPPTPFDHAAWKRHYLSCVTQLQWSPPQVSYCGLYLIHVHVVRSFICVICFFKPLSA